MKRKTSKYISLILLTGLLATVSCEKWIDPKINDNPNAQEEVSLYLILPSVEVTYGYTMGGMDMVGYISIWINQLTGDDRQAQAADQYVQTADDINNLWGACYSGIMEDCKKMIDQASKSGAESPNFRGIAKIIMAATLGQTTSMWGDIPYKEAFQLDGNLSPAYDSQQSIYASINTLLDEAITDLAVPPAGNNQQVESDLIYGGDLNLWTKAAYTLKARFAMHLSKKGETTAATAVLAALTNGFSSSSDDALISFDGASSQSESPMYQFINQRSGYLIMDAGFHTLLTDDPRQLVLANTTLEDNAYMASNASIPFVTYTEACFLKAEALMIQPAPDAAGAAIAYNNGLEASLRRLGVYDATWFNANKLSAGTITRQLILEGKYIAMCGTIEPFNDWRRTGYPVLTPNAGNMNNNLIPVRYIYPTNERNYNRNCPTGITINSKLWVYQ